MNKTILLISRIFVTVLVAAIVSGVIAVIIMFLLANIGVANEDSFTTGNAIFYMLFGLATGYRLNDLLNQTNRKS